MNVYATNTSQRQWKVPFNVKSNVSKPLLQTTLPSLLRRTLYTGTKCDNFHSRSTQNKKAQLSLTNPRDAKAWQNCSNSTCLQRCRWQYWPIFMRLTAITENSNLWSSKSSKVIDLGVNRKPMYDFLLVGLGKSGYFFWNECFLWPNYLQSTNMPTKFACDAVLGR